MRTPRGMLLAALVIFGGCAATIPAQCSTEGMDPQPELTCEMAIPAVRERLTFVRGVDDFEVRYGGFCPPTADCPGLSDRTSARVYIDMQTGEVLTMTVTLLPDGSVQATQPEPMPGPTPLP
jgi:hypothetical protein